MLKRSRKLTFFKWAGLVGCVVLVGAWVGSIWWSFGLDASDAFFGSAGGCIVFGTNYPDTLGLHFYLYDWTGVTWLPSVVDVSSGIGVWIFIPHWMFLAVLLPVTIWLWRRDRIPPGHCTRCGYNLTGNISGRCSECGTVLAEKVKQP